MSSNEDSNKAAPDVVRAGDQVDGQHDKSINIIVKTSKERESFQIESDASIARLRSLVSDRYKVDPSKVCLIFSGKILKDADTLETHSMFC